MPPILAPCTPKLCNRHEILLQGDLFVNYNAPAFPAATNCCSPANPSGNAAGTSSHTAVVADTGIQLTKMEPDGPQARKPLQRLPLQDMNGSRTWPMGSASWPRYTPRNILISRSSREIRACATTRRAPARQPPDRPSRGEIFARVRNHSAGRGSVDFACTPLLPYM